MTFRIALAVASALLAAGPALSQTPPVGRAGEIVVKARRPIVVVADTCPEPAPGRHPSERAPVVTDSYPAAGATVKPGYVRVRVSFDQPMSCYSEVMVDGEGDPCQPDGTWALPERRSWMMTCRFQPRASYRISFRRIEGRGFVGLSGREAAPYELDVTTSDVPATTSVADAARLDPGPPDIGRRTTALVTCADTGHVPAGGRDCRREAATPPPE